MAIRFNTNSIGNRSKAIIWNGKEYPSGSALQRSLGLKSSWIVYQSLKLDKPLMGFYLDYAITK